MLLGYFHPSFIISLCFHKNFSGRLILNTLSLVSHLSIYVKESSKAILNNFELSDWFVFLHTNQGSMTMQYFERIILIRTPRKKYFYSKRDELMFVGFIVHMWKNKIVWITKNWIRCQKRGVNFIHFISSKSKKNYFDTFKFFMA